MSSETTGSMLYLKVLTPKGSVLEGEVSEVTLPGSEGEMGIFPQHAALLTRLVPGKLSYRAPDGADTVALDKGVAEVHDNGVTVLVDQAVLSEEISLESLEERKKKLLAEIDSESHTEKVAALEEELRYLEVQIEIGRG